MIKLMLSTVVVLIYLIEFSHGDLSLNYDFNDVNLNFNQIKQLIESFNNETLVKAVKFGSDHMERMKSLEHRIAAKVKIERGSISYAQLLDSFPGKDLKDINYIAETMLKSSSYLLHSQCKQLGISSSDCAKFMSQFPLPQSNLKQKCYNQLRKTQYKAYRRILPAQYRDGLQKFRQSTTGHELPLPQEIAKSFYLAGRDTLNEKNSKNEGILDKRRNLALTQWAQFLEHDVAKTAFQSMENGSPIECCDVDSSKIAPRYTHPSCAPILISDSDSFYKPLRVSCLNYVRSALAIENHCKFGEAQQLNQATNKLDLSQIYGVTREDTEKLRTFRQGQLRISNNQGSPLLPIDNENCMTNAILDSPCYASGDSRVNVNPYVTILYTIFLRSHNQIAQKLKNLNPHWDDEKIFDTARKINTAIYQKIIYSDWTSVVLGSKFSNEVINKKFVDSEFTKNIKTEQVSNEFATVGIKFYNSMVPGDLFDVHDESTLYLAGKLSNVIDASESLKPKRKELFKLQDVFYKPKDLSKFNLFDKIEKAILQQPAMALDSSYVDDLTYQMYRSKMYENQLFGADSLAFDIQRGRDHGLPSYISYIKKCMNIKISKWEDLHGIVNDNDLEKLKSIYSSIDDVDAIVGALCEIPPENATVGPTFSCFIGEQLVSSKLSDDNFYNRFSEENDDKLEKTVENYSATRLICDTTKLEKVQRNIFLLPSDDNPMINCLNYQELPKLDLSYWIDH